MNITTALPIIPAYPMPASDSVGQDNQQRSLVRESSAAPENGTATDQNSTNQQRPIRPDKKSEATTANKTSSEDESASGEAADTRRPEDKTEADRTPVEQREIEQQLRELKSRDAEVRTHEQAHAAVGGQYAGSPSYEYERGSDGKSYAVGGEVPIDVSVVADDPQATIQKMTVVRRAALAPAEPSSADRAIAADAATKAAQARAELAQQNNIAEEESDSSVSSLIRGPITKALEEARQEEQTDKPAVAAAGGDGFERKTLSAPERGAMIANFYQQRVSPSASGFTASA